MQLGPTNASTNTLRPLSVFERVRKAYAAGGERAARDIVFLLRSIGRYEFDSESHYRYYRMYVTPKLSRIGKEYYHLRRVVRVDLDVVLASNYVLLHFMTVSGGLVVGNHYYLIGRTNSGKLFVNRVWIPLEILRLDGHTSYTLGDSRVEVYTTEDAEIRRALGYDHDYDHSEEVYISSEGRYRVQGEVVVSASNTSLGISGPDSLKDFIIHGYRRAVRDYVSLLLLDRVASILFSLGFNPNHTRDRLVVEGALPMDEDLHVLARALAGELRKACDVVTLTETYRTTYEIAVRCREYGVSKVMMRTGIRRWGTKHYPVEVAAEVVECGELCREIAEDLRRSLENLGRSDHTFALGDHYINVKNSVSVHVVYTPPVRPLYLEDRDLVLNTSLYYVDGASEVLIGHNEHGTTRVKFSGPFLISFTTTNTDRDYPREQNRVALQLLKRRKA